MITPSVDPKNIVDVAIEAGNFKTLVQLLTDLDLVDTLINKDAQTIFAPSDEAFEKLPEGTLESLTDQQAKAIVLRHVLGGITVPAADVTPGPVKTLRCGLFFVCLLSFPQNERKIYKLRQLSLSQFVYFLRKVCLLFNYLSAKRIF